MKKQFDERVARQVAKAAGTFEHLLLGRTPRSVTVVADGRWMVVGIHEAFSPVERRLAADEEGLSRVQDFHRYLLTTRSTPSATMSAGARESNFVARSRTSTRSPAACSKHSRPIPPWSFSCSGRDCRRWAYR